MFARNHANAGAELAAAESAKNAAHRTEAAAGQAAGSPAPAAASSARRRWGRHHAGYRANRIMLWLGVTFLPLGYFVVALTVPFFALDGKVRRASRAFCRKLYPDASPWRQTCFSLGHIYRFGTLLLDRAVALAGNGERFNFERSGMEHLRALAPSPRGIVIFTAHFGCAEITAPLLNNLNLGRKINVVMFQDLSDATEQFHQRHRTALSHVNLISTTDPMAAGLKVIAALRRHEVVAIRADRSLTGRTVAVSFFNQTVYLPAGPFIAAVAADAEPVTLYAIRLKYRHYRCVVAPLTLSPGETPAAKAASLAQQYATQLEALVRQYPRQWANFYDFWATEPADPATGSTSASTNSHTSAERSS
ncbi:MAG: lysophospholipid acyltransferase family protein [Phycisphaerales bacterium]|nr:lysophospholipid acyltransferase family protein [Phycisphaerales bacterium]